MSWTENNVLLSRDENKDSNGVIALASWVERFVPRVIRSNKGISFLQEKQAKLSKGLGRDQGHGFVMLARHLIVTAHVRPSTQVYNRVAANLMWGVPLWWTSILPSRYLVKIILFPSCYWPGDTLQHNNGTLALKVITAIKCAGFFSQFATGYICKSKLHVIDLPSFSPHLAPVAWFYIFFYGKKIYTV